MPSVNLELKTKISEAILAFQPMPLNDAAINLLGILGYTSDKRIALPKEAIAARALSKLSETKQRDLDLEQWVEGHLLLQLTSEDLASGSLFSVYDENVADSYLFYAIEMKDEDYSKGKLSKITRALNALFAMPVLILFKYGHRLTFSVIDRRQHKRDGEKDVLEKVTLIKDISIAKPHRAHVEILFELSLEKLRTSEHITSWRQLHDAWKKKLNISELNKKFYEEIANWYFWAKKHVS